MQLEEIAVLLFLHHDAARIVDQGFRDVLVLTRAQGGDLLVPAIASVVREVDIAGGRVVVVPQDEL